MEHFKGIRFAPHFRERYQKQQGILTRKEPRYYWSRGDYSDADGSDKYSGITLFYMKPGYISLETNERERHNVTELLGIEEHFRDRITTLMQQKMDDPVICMDLGGLRGLSWARLASHFQQEVKNGRVAFVTSSLSEPSELRPVQGTRRKLRDITKEEASLLRSVKREGLMQELFGPVSKLKRMSVNVNGREIPLQRNVDILFESVSLTAWSKVPDLEILQAGKLLSGYGAYYIREVDTQVLQPSEGFGRSFREEWQQRLQGIGLAFEQLESLYGLKRIRKAEEGKYKGVPLTYCLFRKANAPRVRADN